jgi:hypothetical protein
MSYRRDEKIKKYRFTFEEDHTWIEVRSADEPSSDEPREFPRQETMIIDQVAVGSAKTMAGVLRAKADELDPHVSGTY